MFKLKYRVKVFTNFQFLCGTFNHFWNKKDGNLRSHFTGGVSDQRAKQKGSFQDDGVMRVRKKSAPKG